MRIVSLVPSVTKTVCDFGLREHIVGITNFCVDPPDLWRTVRRIGGTKDPDLRAIANLDPTHIIANSEENRRDDIEALARDFNLLTTFPKSPNDVPGLLEGIGDFIGASHVGRKYANTCQSLLTELSRKSFTHQFHGQKFLYLIWKDPWMAVGSDTYISRFLELLGLKNTIATEDRYPVLDPKGPHWGAVDLIFMSSEPWPFRKRDAQELSSLLGSPVPPLYWIDGKAMSWHGGETISAMELWLRNKPPMRRLL
jgi:iron complex transport system substrate-binding protein